MNEPETIRDFLGAKTIAVVGLSPDCGEAEPLSCPPTCSSMGIQNHSCKPYRSNTVLGEKSYASLSKLPEKPDVVNVFRGAAVIPRIAEEMERLGLC